MTHPATRRAPVRAVRSDGARSRGEILAAATRLATTHGLHHLSIAELADAAGMSKSGLYAHFGSKEELQLATITAAEATYDAEVLDRIAGLPPGRDALLALADAHLDHLRRRVFPGGCFFDAAAGDLGGTDGPVADRVRTFQAAWLDRVRGLVRAAQANGEVAAGEDADLVAFDIAAAMLLAHSMLAFMGDESALDRAARSVRSRLGAGGARPSAG